MRPATKSVSPSRPKKNGGRGAKSSSKSSKSPTSPRQPSAEADSGTSDQDPEGKPNKINSRTSTKSRRNRRRKRIVVNSPDSSSSGSYRHSGSTPHSGALPEPLSVPPLDPGILACQGARSKTPGVRILNKSDGRSQSTQSTRNIQKRSISRPKMAQNPGNIMSSDAHRGAATGQKLSQDSGLLDDWTQESFPLENGENTSSNPFSRKTGGGNKKPKVNRIISSESEPEVWPECGLESYLPGQTPDSGNKYQRRARKRIRQSIRKAEGMSRITPFRGTPEY